MMLFLASFDRFTHEELVGLLAFAEAATFSSVLREPTERTVAKAKSVMGKAGHRVTNMLEVAAAKSAAGNHKGLAEVGSALKKTAEANERLAGKWDRFEFDPFTLDKEFERKRRELEPLDLAALRQRFLDLLCDLGSVSKKDRAEPSRMAISRKILAVVAKRMKIDTNLVAPEDVERLVFEKHLEASLKQIQAAIAKSGTEQEPELEVRLQKELDKMGSGEKESLREALHLEQLTAKTFISMLRSGGISLATLTTIHAAGFGAFMALASLLKAISLFLGITFGFGTYLVASSFLGFLTGPFGFGLVLISATGVAGSLGRNIYRRTLLTTLVASMHARLLS
jgi:hypothetical protein